jgi:aerobic carbon-monoxide dehydrogenase medium subunit
VKAPPFDYVAPDSLDEVLAVLHRHGDDARIIAGGQSLVPLMAFRLADPALLVDLRRLEGLRSWTVERNSVIVGATVTQTRLSAISEVHPLVREAVPLIAHPQIRNRGTVGGSLAHADPSAELPAVAMALDAEIAVASPDGERTVSAAEFFISYFTTALRAGEVLTAVRVPRRRPGEGFAILEVSRRPGDFALVGVVVRATLGDDGAVSDAAVVPFSVGERPTRSPIAEAVLVNREPVSDRIAEAADAAAAEVDPPTDMHASGDYRRRALRVLVERALASAIERSREPDGR